ncbi:MULTISPECIES: hypothetical protein [Neorhizobium]|jgi:hypothetical protein|uniref:hypothetical protein n=1 Tax=Neorhizobium TaxID=1525371 RepID=UPI00155E3F3D|nr:MULTISPECIES: hypothetical protein [Neorhizobium]
MVDPEFKRMFDHAQGAMKAYRLTLSSLPIPSSVRRAVCVEANDATIRIASAAPVLSEDHRRP